MRLVASRIAVVCLLILVAAPGGGVAEAERPTVKRLTVLGSQVISEETAGKDFSAPYVGPGVDLVADDGFKSAATLGNATGVGRVNFQLVDKYGLVAYEFKGKLSVFAQLKLSTEPGPSGPSPLHNPAAGLSSWIVDEDTFSSGRVRIEIAGRYEGSILARVAILGFNNTAYLERRDMAGQWVIEIPFTVEEF